MTAFEYGAAICYSGYREGQSPVHGVYPSETQILEDLRLLAADWRYLRLYDCSLHAERVLKVVRDEGLPFRVMLGVDLAAEVSNPNCPWGGVYPEDELAANRRRNREHFDRAIALSNQYAHEVFAVSIGNEASVEWNDHMVSVEALVGYATLLKANIAQPVTFCENYVPWVTKLAPLVDVLDFISVHTYPVWEYKHIDEALAYTEDNYRSVAERYPRKTVIITEAGWTTASNGRGIEPWNATEDLQLDYCRQLLAWSREHQVLTFVFEAFDEPWKGSDDPLEPEKHWGLFFEDRTPKRVAAELFGAPA